MQTMTWKNAGALLFLFVLGFIIADGLVKASHNIRMKTRRRDLMGGTGGVMPQPALQQIAGGTQAIIAGAAQATNTGINAVGNTTNGVITSMVSGDEYGD